jgi:hypothetical protein
VGRLVAIRFPSLLSLTQRILTASLKWISSLNGKFGEGGSFDIEASSLSVGTHTITASVIDSGGLPGGASISIIVKPNTGPDVSIEAPEDDSEFGSGDLIQFSGTAKDDEDGVLTASLEWTSNRDGSIGTGGSFVIKVSSLSVGTHTITASVIDSGKLPGNASVSIFISNIVVFDFEELTPTFDFSDGRQGKLTSLTSVKSGITIEVFREDNNNFDTRDNDHNLVYDVPVVEFGSVSLDPFIDPFSANSAFIVNFSIPVSSVSVAMGDSNSNLTGDGPGDDEAFILEAYSLANATGMLLDSDGATQDNPFPPPPIEFGPHVTLFVAATGECIRSILTEGGSQNPDQPDQPENNSVIYDSIIVEAPCEFAHKITDISLSPSSPDTLKIDEEVNVDFNYYTEESGGVRIYVTPFTDKSPSPNYIAEPDLNAKDSTLHPTGSGSDSARFTVTSGDVTVNQIQFIMYNADHSKVLLEFFTPASYTFLNTEPNVNISMPADKSQFFLEDTIQFAGTAIDDEDGDLTDSLVWTSLLDKQIKQIGTGGSFENSSLSLGTHTITASVTDSGGLSASASVSITIIPNTAPFVDITSPETDLFFTSNTSIKFTGEATDDDEGDLTNSLVWTSKLLNKPNQEEIAIGKGGTFETKFSIGQYEIKASVTDSGGLTSFDSIIINIEDPV